MEDLEKADKQSNLLRAVKKMTLKNKGLVEYGCIKDSSGQLVVEGSNIKQIWKNYYDNLLNEEFDWNRDLLDTACPVEGPSEQFSISEVSAVRRKPASLQAFSTEICSNIISRDHIAGETQ